MQSSEIGVEEAWENLRTYIKTHSIPVILSFGYHFPDPEWRASLLYNGEGQSWKKGKIFMKLLAFLHHAGNRETALEEMGKIEHAPSALFVPDNRFSLSLNMFGGEFVTAVFSYEKLTEKNEELTEKTVGEVISHFAHLEYELRKAGIHSLAISLDYDYLMPDGIPREVIIPQESEFNMETFRNFKDAASEVLSWYERAQKDYEYLKKVSDAVPRTTPKVPALEQLEEMLERAKKKMEEYEGNIKSMSKDLIEYLQQHPIDVYLNAKGRENMYHEIELNLKGEQKHWEGGVSLIRLLNAISHGKEITAIKGNTFSLPNGINLVESNGRIHFHPPDEHYFFTPDDVAKVILYFAELKEKLNEKGVELRISYDIK